MTTCVITNKKYYIIYHILPPGPSQILNPLRKKNRLPFTFLSNRDTGRDTKKDLTAVTA